ncbi:hypothetical protein LEP1GSC123_1332 [Leptospira borgpetersenii str. 200701203]|uniref:Uncharacterized protein n=1 Tax=Leptospira borgpetersenii str. 200701203 TaxID=1193007 RepID=M3HRA7_LEPBO|nr:hypothetical protein LEP1GSC123_1332 [Leptospira borgpetersenii str. 200701203]
MKFVMILQKNLGFSVVGILRSAVFRMLSEDPKFPGQLEV